MIILSCDHAGYDYIKKVEKYLTKQHLAYKYCGPKEYNPDDDYPDFIAPASKEVLKNKNNIGIFICGSGIGANIVANRHVGIRAVNALDKASAYLARQDEDANVLNTGARLISYQKFVPILKTFLSTKFAGGRHLRRIKKY